MLLFHRAQTEKSPSIIVTCTASPGESTLNYLSGKYVGWLIDTHLHLMPLIWQLHWRSVWGNLGPRLTGGDQSRRQRQVLIFYTQKTKKCLNWMNGKKINVKNLPDFSPPLNCRYARLMTSVMAEDCRYLLEALTYNPDLFKGQNSNTLNVFNKQLQKIWTTSCVSQVHRSVCLMNKYTCCLVSVLQFTAWLDHKAMTTAVSNERRLLCLGKSCNVKLLQSEEMFTEDLSGLDSLTQHIFLITVKK